MIIRHKSHVKLIVIILIALAIIGGVAVAFIYFAPFQKKTSTSISPHATSLTTKKSTKASTTGTNSTSNANGDNTPVQYSDSNGNSITNDGSNNSTGDLVINAALSTQSKSNIVSTVINITNLVSNDGSCQITAGNYTTSTPIIANSNYSSCEINSIPLANANKGQSFNITVKSGDRSGSVSGVIQ